MINTDLAATYSAAIPELKRTGVIRRRCRHRPVQCLNNIIEQDHRAIKRRVNAPRIWGGEVNDRRIRSGSQDAERAGPLVWW